MKFSELVAQAQHDPSHIAGFTLEEGEERLALLKRNPSLAVFAENLTVQEAMVMVSEDGLSIEYIPASLQTDDMRIAAIENDPDAFRFIHQRSDAILDFALEQDGNNLMYFDTDDKTVERCIAAVTKSPSAIRYCNPAVFDAEDEAPAADE